MTPLRLLVIGRQGQLARALAERAAGTGVEARFIGRPELDLEAGDNLAPLPLAWRPDVVVNAAAWTAVDAAEDDPGRAFAINAVAPGILATRCAEASIAFIHISTDYVFDGRKGVPYVESDRPAPLGVYGAGKLEGERRVIAAHPGAVILRTAWLVSPFGRNFVRTMLRQAKSGASLRVVADQHGSPTSAFDLADAVLAVARQMKTGAAPAGLFHATGRGDASWHELACQVMSSSASAGGPTGDVTAIPGSTWPTRAQRPRDTRLDTARLAETFGVTMPDWRVSIDAVVCRIVRDGTMDV